MSAATATGTCSESPVDAAAGPAVRGYIIMQHLKKTKKSWARLRAAGELSRALRSVLFGHPNLLTPGSESASGGPADQSSTETKIKMLCGRRNPRSSRDARCGNMTTVWGGQQLAWHGLSLCIT